MANNRNNAFNSVGRIGLQTLSSTLKTREITKNNFGMPRIDNKKFFPVNKVEAKQQIFRTIGHETEQDSYLNQDLK